MTVEEGCILTAKTGIMLTKTFAEFQSYSENLLGRPLMTHEFASKELWKELSDACDKQFLKLMESQTKS